MKGKISKHFSYSEFEESAVAKAHGIKNEIPNDEIKGNIEALVTYVLEPLRCAWGMPLKVNSGYRCRALNELVGGVETSQHRKGEAADISAKKPIELARLAIVTGVPFDQMIIYPTFVHFSFSREKGKDQRWQILYNKSYKGERL